MKLYKVKVNGKVYEVELESVTETNDNIKVDPQPKVREERPVSPSGGAIVKAPMQGSILNVKVSIGQTVKKGECVVILEAMKLENEIVSPVTGVIKEILVTNGQNVNNQQPLIRIE